jgi:hypothetical protein
VRRARRGRAPALGLCLDGAAGALGRRPRPAGGRSGSSGMASGTARGLSTPTAGAVSRGAGRREGARGGAGTGHRVVPATSRTTVRVFCHVPARACGAVFGA